MTTSGWAVWTEDTITEPVAVAEERRLAPARTVAVSWADEVSPAPPSGRRLQVIGVLMILSAGFGAAITYL